MLTSIHVDLEIAEKFIEAVRRDPYVQETGTFESFAFITFLSDGVGKISTFGYNSGEEEKSCNLKIPAQRLLAEVTEGTWLENRDDQPEMPVASILIYDPSVERMLVHYYTGADALEWSVADTNRHELSERLRPPSIAPEGKG